MATTKNQYTLRSTLTGLYFDGYGANETDILKAKRFDLVSAIFIKAQYNSLEVILA
jgi:hypothetical protein